MRGRTLAHVGGMLGLAAIATGITLGASAGAGNAAPRRAALGIEETQALEAAADERPAFVVAPRALSGGAPANGSGAVPGAETDEKTDPVVRTWSVRVVDPDDRPVPGTRVTVQFQRLGNTSYPHCVGAPLELESGAEGTATTAVPDEASFVVVEARAPPGWVAPGIHATRWIAPLQDALGRARVARYEAARRTARIEVAAGGDHRLGPIKVVLEPATEISGRVDVPEGFPAEHVVVTASWVSALDQESRWCSVYCERDGTFRLAVPTGARALDIEAMVAECPGDPPRPWFDVPDGPAAVVAPAPFSMLAPCDDPPEGEEVASAPTGRRADRSDLTPVRASRIAPGATDVRLRMEATARALLEVLDAEGNAACAGTVLVVDARGRAGRARMVGPHRGQYQMLGLAPGPYRLVVSGEAGVARVTVHVPAPEPVIVRLRRSDVAGRLAGVAHPEGWRARWMPDDGTSPGVEERIEVDGRFRLRAEAGVRGRVVVWGDVPGEAGWAEAVGVSAECQEIELFPAPGRPLSGRVVGLPPSHFHDLRVRWLDPRCVREAVVASDGTFRFEGLPEGSATLELVAWSARFLRWPAVASGRTNAVFRFPSPDAASDVEGDTADLGLTPEPYGR